VDGRLLHDDQVAHEIGDGFEPLTPARTMRPPTATWCNASAIGAVA
jgi:hypothetical protein